MKKKMVLIGGGGYCKGVLDSLLNNNLYDYVIVGITDPTEKIGTLISNIPIIGNDDILQTLYDSGVKYAHITVGSVGDCSLRKKLVTKARKIGFELVSIIDASAIIADDVKLGEMIYVGKRAVINANVEIGKYCIINTGSIVEHGCKLGDYVHVAPGAVLVGDITVGCETHLGLNCSILQGLTIGNQVIVGAATTVLRNIEDNEKVVGLVKKRKNI